jgi:hypothetical protein
MFRIERTSLPQVGQEVSFFCRLSAGSEIEKDRCEFEGPSGQTLFTRPNTEMVDHFIEKEIKDREREREREKETDRQRDRCEFEGPSGQTFVTHPSTEMVVIKKLF